MKHKFTMGKTRTNKKINRLNFLYKALSIGNLIWMIFAAIMVEMTLNYNHVKNVISLLDTFYPAQLLPMLIGAFGLLRILFLLFWSIYEPEDREQGESATAPPEDAQGNPSVENEIRKGRMQATDEGSEIHSEKLPASLTQSPTSPGTAIVGHDQNDNLVVVRRSLFRRYLVAWLPWLSQFPFWTKPAGGYQQTRERSRAWALPRSSRSSNSAPSRLAILRKRPPQTTSTSIAMTKNDEKV